MRRTKTYGAILVLLAFCAFSMPRVFTHHCEDSNHELSHKHTGETQLDHPDCPLCSLDVPVEYQAVATQDLPNQLFAANPKTHLSWTPINRDLPGSDARGPPKF